MMNYALAAIPLAACLITGIINKRKVVHFTCIISVLVQLVLTFIIKTNELRFLFLLINNFTCFILILFLHSVYTKLILRRLLTSSRIGLRYAFVFAVTGISNLIIMTDALWIIWLSIFLLFMAVASIYYIKRDFYDKIKFHIYVLSTTILACTLLYSIIYTIKMSADTAGMKMPGLILPGAGIFLIIAGIYLIYKEKTLMKLFLFLALINYGVIFIGIGLFSYTSLTASLVHICGTVLVQLYILVVGENICLAYITDNISNISGILTDKPVLGIFILTGILCATSLPPFSLFFNEIRIIHNSFTVHNYFISAVLLIKNLIFTYILFKKLMPILYGSVKNPGKSRDILAGSCLIVIILYLLIISGLFIPVQFNDVINKCAGLILGDLL